MKRRAVALLPKREVIRRTQLAPATLAALIRARAFPSPVMNGRREPAAVDRWVSETMRQAPLSEERGGEIA